MVAFSSRVKAMLCMTNYVKDFSFEKCFMIALSLMFCFLIRTHQHSALNGQFNDNSNMHLGFRNIISNFKIVHTDHNQSFEEDITGIKR